VRCARCFPVQIAFPVSLALLGCAVISSNATRSAGTACFKLAPSLVIGDEFVHVLEYLLQ